jgi:arylsulfatase A-like enzyme
VVSQTVINTDTAPTLLDLAGVATPGDMQGRSLLELLGGSPPADWRTNFYFNHYQWGANNVVPYYGIRTSRYKLINHYGRDWGGRPAWELIDLEADPDERTNVYDDAQYASVVPQLKAELLSVATGIGISPVVNPCPGDMDGNGVIGIADVLSVRKCFGLRAEGTCTLADFDGNGFVSVSDVIRARQAFGKSCTL